MALVEGFFPEREILALRRQQQLPVDPVQPADSQRKAVWVALGTGFLLPIWVAGWNSGVLKRPGVLLVACYLVAGFALTGVVIGLYRALLSGKRPARV
jgi:hypothetical protein